MHTNVAHTIFVQLFCNLKLNGKMLSVFKRIFQNMYGIGLGRLDVIISKKNSTTGNNESGKGK